MNPKEHLVLFVDDERANRIVFETSMASKFRVKAVASGAEALEVFKNDTVAVILTDQRMPEMTGHDLLAKVKTLYPDTLRMVITAHGDLDPILRAINEGLVARYLVKPWDRAELEGLISWALEAFHFSREGSALQLRLMHTERLVTLGSIAAAVIHDLHQPLANLLVNAERLKHHMPVALQMAQLANEHKSALPAAEQRAFAEVTSELPEIAEDLSASIKLMLGLTEGLQHFMHPERERRVEPVDPIPVIRHALSVCQETAVRARGRLGYEGPAALPRVRVDATELSQILINLVANGAQALLQRNQRGGRVTVRVADEGPFLRFFVTDDGVGMSEETLKKVGKLFFSTRAEGTGLGVAQCWRLIGRSGGQYQIESKEGKGTTVTFTLPKA